MGPISASHLLQLRMCYGPVFGLIPLFELSDESFKALPRELSNPYVAGGRWGGGSVLTTTLHLMSQHCVPERVSGDSPHSLSLHACGKPCAFVHELERAAGEGRTGVWPAAAVRDGLSCDVRKRAWSRQGGAAAPMTRHIRRREQRRRSKALRVRGR